MKEIGRLLFNFLLAKLNEISNIHIALCSSYYLYDLHFIYQGYVFLGYYVSSYTIGVSTNQGRPIMKKGSDKARGMRFRDSIYDA